MSTLPYLNLISVERRASKVGTAKMLTRIHDRKNKETLMHSNTKEYDEVGHGWNEEAA